MSTPPEPEAGVHRLVDMVVEEVSLVDRGANKRRFLIVKRDKPMGDNRKNASSEEAADTETDNKPKRKADGDALSIATTALELLTAAVEQLGSAGDNDATSIVTDLAERLAEVATELAASVGMEASAAEETDGVAKVVEAVRSTLSQVSELIASAAAKNASDPAPAPVADNKESEVSKQLTTINTSLCSLTDAVRDQAQRIGRLEKGVGLPNSRQAPERSTPRPVAEEVSWPLDMNRPMDRESVDKTVSFHDR